MKIYFACSIIGGRKDENVYQEIVEKLTRDGHQVLTEGLVGKNILQLDGVINPVDIYERDTSWIDECEILIAEVSTPSHGVGYEIGYALNSGKPVICLYHSGIPVSKMILGNRHPNLKIFAYETVDSALDFLKQQIHKTENICP